MGEGAAAQTGAAAGGRASEEAEVAAGRKPGRWGGRRSAALNHKTPMAFTTAEHSKEQRPGGRGGGPAGQGARWR